MLLMCRHRKDLLCRCYCCFKAVTLTSSSDFAAALKIDVCQIEFATSSKEQSKYIYVAKFILSSILTHTSVFTLLSVAVAAAIIS